MEDKLFEMITGEEGFIVTLRCDNKFDEEKYNDIKKMLKMIILTCKQEGQISTKSMLAIVELVDCLVGGSRFFDDKEAIKVEDASIEVKDIINELYEMI